MQTSPRLIRSHFYTFSSDIFLSRILAVHKLFNSILNFTCLGNWYASPINRIDETIPSAFLLLRISVIQCNAQPSFTSRSSVQSHPFLFPHASRNLHWIHEESLKIFEFFYSSSRFSYYVSSHSCDIRRWPFFQIR